MVRMAVAPFFDSRCSNFFAVTVKEPVKLVYIRQTRNDNTLRECTIFGCIVASDGNVFVMTTIMATPATVVAVTNESLSTEAAKIVQPYSTVSIAVPVWCRPANTSARFTSIRRF